MRRIHRHCCGKETFATEQVAIMRLRTVQNNFSDAASDKIPCRAYECEHGNWHLTSIPMNAWERMQAYEASHPERLPSDHSVAPKLSPVAQAASVVFERDGSCVICESSRGLTIMVRGSAKSYGGVTKEARRTLLANLIVVCIDCERTYNTNLDLGWEGGWKLYASMDPERYPVFHHLVWVYLSNDGSIELAEDISEAAVETV